MDELRNNIRALRDRLERLLPFLNLAAKEMQLAALKQRMADPHFWDNRTEATRVSREAAELEKIISFWNGARQKVLDLESVAADDAMEREISLLAELKRELQQLTAAIDAKENEAWMSGEYDTRPAILTIYSGAGGVDAQDWAEMLERMYLKFGEQREFTTTILHRTPGAEAGIKNVTIRFEGPFAYGLLKAESGVHRLVRISPYDADQARHTSFAAAEVLPELDELGAIEIGKDDVRVDVFRSSGHGGQSVNTTDSAVRLTHLPTGLTVAMQNERSQMQNKEAAWKILLGKLARYYAAKREEERAALRGEFTEAAWGNQIRSYVLHPYKLVKDHRTKLESKNPDAVLGGDIMPFIEAELQRQMKE